jgi:hypothetical protein|eukprot:SAG25_NODE_74_length_16997_cov_287.503166_11_plen_88_part_00
MQLRNVCVLHARGCGCSRRTTSVRGSLASGSLNAWPHVLPAALILGLLLAPGIVASNVKIYPDSCRHYKRVERTRSTRRLDNHRLLT